MALEIENFGLSEYSLYQFHLLAKLTLFHPTSKFYLDHLTKASDSIAYGRTSAKVLSCMQQTTPQKEKFGLRLFW
jgi:hypothetical protein